MQNLAVEIAAKLVGFLLMRRLWKVAMLMRRLWIIAMLMQRLWKLASLPMLRRLLQLVADVLFALFLLQLTLLFLAVIDAFAKSALRLLCSRHIVRYAVLGCRAASVFIYLDRICLVKSFVADRCIRLG